ncbi:MAG TPA: MarR family winged helix-turn-helix transcriptional regulator [Streptosporangiaceae bacterium]
MSDEREQTPLATPDVDIEDIDAVTTAVLTASRLLIAISIRSLTAVQDAVTLPQFRMLVVLATRGETKVVALADDLGVNPSTAMRMGERLVAKGLIDRRVNPESRREVLLEVTEAGQRIVADVTGHRRAEIARIVTRIPPTHRRGLIAALSAFAHAGEEPAAGLTAPDAFTFGWR